MSDNVNYNFVNQTGDKVTFMLVNPDHTEGPHDCNGNATYSNDITTTGTRVIGVWWYGKDELYPSNSSPAVAGADFSNSGYTYDITLTPSGKLTVS